MSEYIFYGGDWVDISNGSGGDSGFDFANKVFLVPSWTAPHPTLGYSYAQSWMLYTEDGIDWDVWTNSMQNLSVSPNNNGIMYAPEDYIVGETLWTSSLAKWGMQFNDSIVNVSVTLASSGDSLGGVLVIYADGKFVAGERLPYSGTKMCSTSQFGNWVVTQTIPSSGGCRSLGYGDGLYVACIGEFDTYGSTDGVSWSSMGSRTSYSVVRYIDGCWYSISTGEVKLSSSASVSDMGWSSTLTGAGNIFRPRGIVGNGDGDVLLLGNNSSSNTTTVYAAGESTAWTPLHTFTGVGDGGGTFGLGIQHINGMYITGPVNKSFYYTSPDGDVWTKRYYPISIPTNVTYGSAFAKFEVLL